LQLERYDTLYAALRRRFDPTVVASAARVPSAREIAELSAASHRAPVQSARMPSVPLAERDGGEGRSRRTRARITQLPMRFDVVAALLLVTLLAGLLAALRSGWWGGPPPLTPQERVYVAVLRADYLPLLDAIGVDSRQCVTAFDKALAGDKPQNMLDCRPVEVAALARSQTLLTDLMNTVPPPRWRGADLQLKTWAVAQITYYTARIQAIDLHDVAQFESQGNHGSGPADSCPAIGEINAALPAESQLPVSASGYCPG
jgi:hypothetical protein